MDGLPSVRRNGPVFCTSCGINYVRFILSFPLESLRRNLANATDPTHSRGVFLPFDRAVGTALVYAFLDTKNIVGHVEMASRIFDAAQLPWRMPTGITFPLLVAEFKAMLSGNLTSGGWMKRSSLWNLVALQNQDGSWAATDSLAGAVKATGPPQLAPPIPSVGPRPIVKVGRCRLTVSKPVLKAPMVELLSSFAFKFNVRRYIKAYYNADELLQQCPPALAAAAGRVGWVTIDMIWCTLLAMEGCKQNGMDWVLNPWDDIFHEFAITQCGWGRHEYCSCSSCSCSPRHRMPLDSRNEGSQCV